ncbi:MFS transporter [Desulfofustis glycolicus]|uniref:Sugar phosphate permease n=1 Tax=Desulfofustis glycolicus DSM 9705 TaxID=1121409 RepID=A0A1M5VAR2_9BACT|nr:MFS transporter [Desulfofustis glycolicus]MCB2218228.1 MFS transporter [Desulfobulbaceae bacterium]SHH72320.1 Sugar phosphate permease [Desulfofustis glycolicus DSM 9705]
MLNLSLPQILGRVFLPFAAGYFLSYLYRVVNAVIAADLTVDLGIGPSALGLLTATYFIAFASFQLPLGVLLDRFGPRRIEALLLLFAGLGALLFARAESLIGLIVGRALIGFGVSSCLMAAFKAYTIWFDRQYWPLINGFQMASGGLGALAATYPVELMLGLTDWRGVFLVLAGATVAVAVIVFLVVPERNEGVAVEPLARQLQGVKQVFSSYSFWRAAPLTTMSQTALLAIQGLWAGPWFRDVAGLDRDGVAVSLFAIAIAMICGFIFLGSGAGRYVRRGGRLMSLAAIGMGLFLVIQILLLIAPTAWALPLWLAFGFFGTSGILAYPALSQAFDLHLSGRVSTALNLLVFSTAFFGQWLIGTIIEWWPVGPDGGYAPEGYRAGFALMATLQLFALLWYVGAERIVGRHVRKTER